MEPTKIIITNTTREPLLIGSAGMIGPGQSVTLPASMANDPSIAVARAIGKVTVGWLDGGGNVVPGPPIGRSLRESIAGSTRPIGPEPETPDLAEPEPSGESGEKGSGEGRQGHDLEEEETLPDEGSDTSSSEEGVFPVLEKPEKHICRRRKRKEGE